MIRHTKIILAALFLNIVTVSAYAGQSVIPMPPRLSFDLDPAEVLRTYPLGVINKQVAFAHHGGPVRKLELPNRNEGWLYKAGENAGVPSIYVLQFSRDGLVIDVLHKDHRYKIGHSALQYQYLSGATPELKTLGPGPGE